VRIVGWLIPLVAACVAPAERTLLEREVAGFKAENERIRAEDLEADYESQKRKADALAQELIGVQRARDRLYREYDALRAEIATLRVRRDAAAAEVASARADLAELETQAQQLAAAVEQARVEAERLRAQAHEASGEVAPG